MNRTLKLNALTADLRAGGGDLPVHPRRPALLRRPDRARRADADGQRVQPGAGLAVLVHHRPTPTSPSWRATVNRLTSFQAAIATARDARRRRARLVAPARRRASRCGTRRSGCRTARRCSTTPTSRCGAGESVAIAGPVRRRQVHPVPRHRRHLAVRQRPDRARRRAATCSCRSGPTSRSARCATRSPIPARAGGLHRRARSRQALDEAGLPSSPTGSTRSRTGRSCCPAASSSGWRSRARCCCGPTGCSSTRRRPASTRRPRPSSTPRSARNLPDTTVISIAHRPEVARFHDEALVFQRRAGRARARLRAASAGDDGEHRRAVALQLRGADAAHRRRARPGVAGPGGGDLAQHAVVEDDVGRHRLPPAPRPRATAAAPRTSARPRRCAARPRPRSRRARLRPLGVLAQHHLGLAAQDRRAPAPAPAPGWRTRRCRSRSAPRAISWRITPRQNAGRPVACRRRRSAARRARAWPPSASSRRAAPRRCARAPNICPVR